MIARRLLLLVLPVLTLSCALPPNAPPLPATAQTIAVLPPNNRTGDPLLVESASFLHPYADRPGRVTVADILATEARAQLARRGIKVIAPEAVTAAIGNQTPRSPEEAAALAARGKLEGSALYIEIRRWEADMSPLHPRRIIGALEARLLDAATGQTVWTAQRPLHPVPTPGAVVRWMAYTIAARKVAEELFAFTPMEEHTIARPPDSVRAWVQESLSTQAMHPDLVICRRFRYSEATALCGRGDVEVWTVARRCGYEGGSTVWGTPTVDHRRITALTAPGRRGAGPFWRQWRLSQ